MGEKSHVTAKPACRQAVDAGPRMAADISRPQSIPKPWLLSDLNMRPAREPSIEIVPCLSKKSRLEWDLGRVDEGYAMEFRYSARGNQRS